MANFRLGNTSIIREVKIDSVFDSEASFIRKLISNFGSKDIQKRIADISALTSDGKYLILTIDGRRIKYNDDLCENFEDLQKWLKLSAVFQIDSRMRESKLKRSAKIVPVESPPKKEYRFKFPFRISASRKPLALIAEEPDILPRLSESDIPARAPYRVPSDIFDEPASARGQSDAAAMPREERLMGMLSPAKSSQVTTPPKKPWR